jgi:SMI1 / KNR4 family (SUKH-1)
VIAQILQKIREIREQKLDTLLLKTEAFLNPPLQKAEAFEIETKLGISLPDDFRDFITSAGNGGLGPGLSLTPFGSSAIIDSRIPTQRNRIIDVAGQFPYTSGWNYEPLRQSMEEGRPDIDKHSEYYFSVDRIQGAIRIGDGGCGAINLLVLNGSERGNIWYDFRGTFGGVCPATRSQKDDARLSFTEWYDAWLSEILLRLPFEERHII